MGVFLTGSVGILFPPNDPHLMSVLLYLYDEYAVLIIIIYHFVLNRLKNDRLDRNLMHLELLMMI
jgi:hypothetical protein